VTSLRSLKRDVRQLERDLLHPRSVTADTDPHAVLLERLAAIRDKQEDAAPLPAVEAHALVQQLKQRLADLAAAQAACDAERRSPAWQAYQRRNGQR
jgi:hypothetical protein